MKVRIRFHYPSDPNNLKYLLTLFLLILKYSQNSAEIIYEPKNLKPLSGNQKYSSTDLVLIL